MTPKIGSQTREGKAKVNEDWPELLSPKDVEGSTKSYLQETNGTIINNGGSSSLGTMQKQLEEAPEKPWANLFATNRLVTWGMDITYIAPSTIEGEKVVEITA